MKAKYLVYLLAATLLLSCEHKQGTKIIIYTYAPLKTKVYIKSVPFFKEKEQIIDSARITSNHDSLTLVVPAGKDERLFKLIVDEQPQAITFINDTKVLRIHLDYFSHKYTVTGSKGTASLRNFEDSQVKYSQNMHKLSKFIDSLYHHHAEKKLVDSLLKQFFAMSAVYHKRYVEFDDTTKSAAAFAKVYSNVDFDTDYKALKKFIVRNAARFPDYAPIQQIKTKALATVRIYEEEFNVGDQLPYISLPDTNGKLFSTSSLKGQYYLIDFWATECDQCMPFKISQKSVMEKANAHRVKLVSVAIDDQKPNWKSLISKNGLHWTHLIDEQMWDGPAVHTLVFDSIPFNFLVAPNGKIIKKAIKPDSLSKVLSELN